MHGDYSVKWRPEEVRKCGLIYLEKINAISASKPLCLIPEEMDYLLEHQRYDHIRNVGDTGVRCSFHNHYQRMPCRHLVRGRHIEANARSASHRTVREYLADDFKGQPLLGRSDVPAVCLRAVSCLPCSGRIPDRPFPASAPSHFDPLETTTDFRTFLKVWEQCQDAHRAWHTYRYATDHLTSNPEHLADEPDGTLHDPPRRRIDGHPAIRPSKNTPLFSERKVIGDII
jgi:hypothetical protein